MIKLADRHVCTGCGACKNICPKNAIEMKPDHEGFIQPVINLDLCVSCGLCEKTCPVLNPVYSNDANPDCYAVMAQDEVRKVSSSGGFFTVVAEEILDRGGVVFGAAWTEDWSVAHTFVESREALDVLRSSKYMQSDVRDTYREAKQFLEAGRPVLYSGCPCQIAGLNAYLKKDYPELFTVEIICHGTPSPKAFKKYINDNFGEKAIRKIDFRDKSIFGWSTTSNIYFDDGTQYHANEKVDSFYKAFLPCMTLRNSCASCPFSKLPRQADLTMGDFWGAEKHRRGANDGKGLSAILVNSVKGRLIFKQLRNRFTLCEETRLEAITHINKTVLHPFSQHSGRKHFFSSMDIKPFNQLVENSLNHHYDIGVVGLWYGINYGSVLTYYALYSLLKDFGYDPVMLPKPNHLWEERFNAQDSIAQRFIWKHCNVFVPFRCQGEYRRVNELCDDFIVGSDVVWGYDICGKQSDQFFFMDWVESGHKKIAYASSFGQGLAGPKEYVNQAVYNLKRMDAISVRENTSVEAARVFCERDDIEFVLDPVFVCDPAIYTEAIAEVENVEQKPFVFAYILRKAMKKEKDALLDAVCRYYGAQQRICGNPNEMDHSRRIYGDRLLPELSIEEWLYYMKNCEMYVGDSYHALCFSLIFHKPFIIIYSKTSENYAGARFSSLLKLVGLEERFLESPKTIQEYERLLRTPIDWNHVDEKLNELRKSSMKWLRNALEADTPKASFEDYVKDAEKRRMSEMDIRLYEQGLMIEELRKTLADQQSKYEELRNAHQSINEQSSKTGEVWLLRKIKGGIICLKDNGVRYTSKRFVQKVKDRVNKYRN